MRAFLLAIIILSLLVPAHAATASGSPPSCAYGAYRSATGDIVAVTPNLPGQPARYTELNGRRGTMTDTDAPTVCSSSAWRRLQFRRTSATFTSKGTTLYGLLLEPIGVKKPPLIVFVHGSERQSPLELYYQLFYAAQGVATFFYDKRGTGRSQGTYTQDFMLLAQDAANAARKARALAAGRFSKLGFYGGSQGGWVAPLAALEVHADFLEVSFGCVCTALEQDEWQVDYQLVHEDRFPSSILPDVHRVTDATADVMGSNSPDFNELARIKDRYGKKAWFSKIDGQYSGDLLHSDPKTAWLENNAAHVPWHYSGLDTLRRLNIPQLWTFAQDDSVAPSARSIARIEDLNKADAVRSIVVFPNVDHGIRKFHVASDGKRVEDDSLADGYLRLLSDFAKNAESGRYGASFSPGS